MGLRRGIWTVALAMVVCAMTTTVARAQDASADSTRAESPLAKMARQSAEGGGAYQLPDSVAASPIGIRYTPTYLNQVSGDVSSVGMKNSFQANIATPFGSTFNFLVSADEKHYRLQNKRDENKQLSASVVHTFNVFTNASIGFINSRVFNRSVVPGGASQDYIFNDKSVNAGSSYERTYVPHSGVLKSIRLDALASGAAVQGERTYKNDQTLALGGFGGIATDLRGRYLRVNGRGGHRETWDRSETSLAEFNELGSSEDSLSTGLLAELGDSVFIDAKYVYYEAERTWADQAQGSLGGQQSGVQYVFQETERRSSRGAVISLNAKVWDRFRVIVTGNHDSQLFDYVIQETRYSNTVSDGLRGTFTYQMPWKTIAIVTLENMKTLRDLGPLSVSSFNDIRKKASIALEHDFSKTFTMDLLGSTNLTRSEYLDSEANPRDRDQVDTSVNLRIGSTPFTSLLTTVSLAYSASEFLNIDASQSENNRTRELYELRPGFTYYMSEHFTISQSYGVAIEYTDFIYTPASNFVDRNLIFANKFDFRPTDRIGFVFDYSYNFHDNGSYLPNPVTGEEELTVQGEDRRDRVNLRLDYRIMSRTIAPKFTGDTQRSQVLGVFAEQRYSRFEDRSVFSGDKSVTTDGLISVGTRGNYEFGNGRKLMFTVARVKRDTPFGSDAEKDYWDIRSDFNFPF